MKKKYELKVNANSKAFVVGGAGFSVEVLDRLENVLVSTVYPGSKYRKYRGISSNIKGVNHKSMEVKKKKLVKKKQFSCMVHWVRFIRTRKREISPLRR